MTRVEEPKKVTRKQFELGAPDDHRIDAPIRVGNQIPPNLWVPPYFSTLGDDAIEFLKLAGITLDEWQEFVLKESLNTNEKGRYAAMEVALLVPRQQGKTVIAEARELVGLFLLNEKLIIHSAQLFPTARESYLRMCARINACDDLEAMVHKKRSGNDNVGIELKNGSRLLYMARGTDPGRGFSGDLVVFDEAYGLTPEVIAAMLPTLSARPNPQIWYCSSTGKEDSEVLLQVRDRGMSQAARVALFEWCADSGCSLDDVEQWYKANPALGIRLEEEFIQMERGTMADKQFARERLGMWADNSVRDVIPLDAWNDCADEDSGIVGDAVAAVDVSPDRASASIAVAGYNARGKRHVEVIETNRGTQWVQQYVKALLGSSKPPVRFVVQGGGSPGSLIAPMSEVGAELIVFGSRDISDATGEIYDAVVEGNLVHLGDPLLTQALGGATRYPIGGKSGEEEAPGFGWARRDVTNDITPLVAATYALHGLSLYHAELAKEPVPHHVGTRLGGRIW